MTLRGFRLAEPYDMYFDEVYHARTAMEFLQDWRYDDPHDIYEYTHPHLAKYAMAAGIELFGDHRVTGESALGVAVRSAALERRWSEGAQDTQRRGDRLYVATGDDVRVYDLETRVAIATIPQRPPRSPSTRTTTGSTSPGPPGPWPRSTRPSSTTS